MWTFLNFKTNLPTDKVRQMSGTVIKFHYVHVLSKTVSSQMQHLQHNFKVNYWFNIKLCEDIRISKRIS